MKSIAVLLVGLLMTSCATIFTGTSDKVSFNSVPEDALVKVNGIDKCRTPCIAKVKRSNDGAIVTMELDGYEDRVFELEQSFNGVAILNLGSLLGWGIDFLSGAIHKYDPKVYNIELEEEE